MNPKSKLIGDEDERAVSPVIGVILMVAITVILAAVIATFVLELGQSQSANPSAGYTINEGQDNTEVRITSVDRLDSWGVVCSGGEDSASQAIEGDLDGDVGETATTSEDCSEDNVLVYGEYDGTQAQI